MEANKKHEKVIFNGVPYRRYPESKRSSDRLYFRCSYTENGKNKTKTLHVAIWECNFGPVPEGFHIHHRDGNSLHNPVDGSNYELRGESRHLSEHALQYHEGHKTKVQQNLDAIRPLASAWHGSEEGRGWHEEHARKIIDGLKPKQCVCQQCGKKYIREVPIGQGKFCSNACKSAWRRKQGTDNIEKTCVICGKPFISNKYQKIEACSPHCRAIFGHKNRASL